MLQLGKDDESPLTHQEEKTVDTSDDLDDAVDMLTRVESVGGHFVDAVQGKELESLPSEMLVAIAEMKGVVHEVTQLMDNYRGQTTDEVDERTLWAMGCPWPA